METPCGRDEHFIVNQKYKGKLEGQKKDGPTNFATLNRLVSLSVAK
jgi:hypothetical protein